MDMFGREMQLLCHSYKQVGKLCRTMRFTDGLDAVFLCLLKAQITGNDNQEKDQRPENNSTQVSNSSQPLLNNEYHVVCEKDGRFQCFCLVIYGFRMIK